MSEAGVYFHGLPGGPAELDALGPGSPLTAIDRMGVAGDGYPARLEAVADRLQAGALQGVRQGAIYEIFASSDGPALAEFSEHATSSLTLKIAGCQRGPSPSVLD